MNPTIHLITGAKGGVGATTITAALALVVARNTGQRVLAVDAADRHDLLVALGRPPAADTGAAAITDLLDVATTDRDDLDQLLYSPTYDHVIVDLGTRPATDFTAVPRCDVQRSLVVRNDYLALRAAGAHHGHEQTVAVCEPGRALTSTDVGAVIDGPLITVTHDPAVARAVDSGLLVARLPFTLDVALRRAHRPARPDVAA